MGPAVSPRAGGISVHSSLRDPDRRDTRGPIPPLSVFLMAIPQGVWEEQSRVVGSHPTNVC